jgi:hypothetical protein
MRDESSKVAGNKLLEFMSDTLPNALGFLREEGLLEAEVVGQKARALVALSGERHLARVEEKLGEAVGMATKRHPEARPHLLALVQLLDKTLAEERQIAKTLGCLFETMLKCPAGQTPSPPPEKHRPKRTTSPFGQLPPLEGHPPHQSMSC